MNSVWFVNGTNLVYYTNIGYFPSQFPVVEKYNNDNGICDDSHTSYYKYYNFHSIKFLRIVSIGGSVGEIGNVLIFLVHAWKIILTLSSWRTEKKSSYLPFTMIDN